MKIGLGLGLTPSDEAGYAGFGGLTVWGLSVTVQGFSITIQGV